MDTQIMLVLFILHVFWIT